jgi:hypothetical protein
MGRLTTSGPIRLFANVGEDNVPRIRTLANSAGELLHNRGSAGEDPGRAS